MNNRSSSRPRRYKSGRPNRYTNYNRLNHRPKQSSRRIDPQRFVNTAVVAEEIIPFTPQHQFSDFGLMPALQQTLKQRGYTAPTPIQDEAILPALAGRDTIGLADTGTGKTAAFVLPIIQRLKTVASGQTALIIAPTRELALQINDEFRYFAGDLGLYSTLCVGGANMNRQISQLTRKPQVIIGTPGRLKDLNSQGVLKLNQVGILVLDEVDRMLDMGFINDIRYLVSKLPIVRQSLCFSATIPSQISALLNEMLTNPVTVSVKTRETSDHVQQDIIRATSKEEKVEILQDLLKQNDFEKVLIFGRTKRGVHQLAKNLTKQGIQAEAIHGNKSQPQRQRALQTFKDGKVGVLVATDVAARGLDIPLVSHVINFDQPDNYNDYIHRIGRTGRAGNQGKALTFVT